MRYLVTTSDERSWKFKEPVVFLGEWCRLYSRRETWQSLDAIVAKPIGLEDGQKELDRVYLNNIIAKLLIELTSALNKIHETKHTERYWNIILGHWLQRFVYVAFNRYSAIHQVLKDHEISGTTVFDLKDYKLATKNTIEFVWALYDNEWNHVFYTRVLDFLKFSQVEIIDIQGNSKRGFDQETNLKPESMIKLFIRNSLNKLLRIFVKKNDALILSSYLPLSYAVELQLRLRQIPAFWSSPIVPNYNFDSLLRVNLKINYAGHQGFEKFLRTVIGEAVPTCFVEGYQSLKTVCSELPWPSMPKFIFTSNNFDTDEIFKMWTAQKVEQGTPYYVGQHGNNYGTWTYSLEMPEISTTDKFISWGWRNSHENIIPAFIFKTVDKKDFKINLRGGLLLVERCLHSRQTTFDNHYENNFYQDEQFRFVNCLKDDVRKHLLVRLHNHKPSNFVWSDEQRWVDYDASIKLEKGKQNLWKLSKEARLIVYSYDSTGILEMLSLNIPTIGFWFNLLEEILPEAKPYYEILVQANILFESPESAASHISKNWEFIDLWWGSENVQYARKTFCNKYAKQVDNPIQTLKEILTKK